MRGVVDELPRLSVVLASAGIGATAADEVSSFCWCLDAPASWSIANSENDTTTKKQQIQATVVMARWTTSL